MLSSSLVKITRIVFIYYSEISPNTEANLYKTRTKLWKRFIHRRQLGPLLARMFLQESKPYQERRLTGLCKLCGLLLYIICCSLSLFDCFFLCILKRNKGRHIEFIQSHYRPPINAIQTHFVTHLFCHSFLAPLCRQFYPNICIIRSRDVGLLSGYCRVIVGLHGALYSALYTALYTALQGSILSLIYQIMGHFCGLWYYRVTWYPFLSSIIFPIEIIQTLIRSRGLASA